MLQGTQLSALPTLPLEGRVATLGPTGRSKAGEGVHRLVRLKFSVHSTTPHPNPPPQGGREPTALASSSAL